MLIPLTIDRHPWQKLRDAATLAMAFQDRCIVSDFVDLDQGLFPAKCF